MPETRMGKRSESGVSWPYFGVSPRKSADSDQALLL